jgi:hypothetical protein
MWSWESEQGNLGVQARATLCQGSSSEKLVPADQGAAIWDPTRHRALAQAREYLKQGCIATAQVGLLIAQAETARAQV